jgi:hypothetical protein
MSDITGIFALLSELLLLPVVVGLLALLGGTCIAAGGYWAEAIERWRDWRRVGPCFHAIVGPDDAARDAAWSTLWRLPVHGDLARFLRQAPACGGHPNALASLLDEIESSMARRLSRIALLQRLGPSLGLMGTLIPMGTVLGAVANGEVRLMATQLVLAFTTTVVGLAIAVISTIIVAGRRRWYADDVSRLERLSDALVEERTP